jgi:hypothetical protein
MSRAVLLTCVLTCVLTFGCAEALPEHVELQAAGEHVDFAAEPPSADAYKLLGQAEGTAAATDLEVAQQAARNDLRNKAAAMGGSLVTLDQNLAEPLPLTYKMKVRLVGRVYQPIE